MNNNSKNYLTSISLNFILFRIKYTIQLKFIDEFLEKTPTLTKDRVNLLDEIREGIVEKLANSQTKISEQYNKRHKLREFLSSLLVKLLTKNLQL